MDDAVKSAVEIKCPSSIAGEKPSSENYPHLEVTETGDSKLKENSPYFYQMYGYMAATESKYCDFLYTQNMNFMWRE